MRSNVWRMVGRAGGEALPIKPIETNILSVAQRWNVMQFVLQLQAPHTLMRRRAASTDFHAFEALGPPANKSLALVIL